MEGADFLGEGFRLCQGQQRVVGRSLAMIAREIERLVLKGGIILPTLWYDRTER